MQDLLRDVTWLHYNVNKPGPSTNMPLPTLKLYYKDPPKLGMAIKTMSMDWKKWKKILTSLKKS